MSKLSPFFKVIVCSVLAVSVNPVWADTASHASSTSNATEAKAAAPATPTPSTKKDKKPVFANETDEVSYILGHQIAQSMKRDGVVLNNKIFLQALSEGLQGHASSLTPQESQKIMEQFFSSRKKEQATKNLKEGQAFLAKNKEQAGIVALPDGLQYKVLTEGTGVKPAQSDTVSVDYEGTLIDGTVFDSSYRRGEPVSFPLTGVIKGWTEVLQLMPVGSTWMVYIPADLAYGEQGPSPAIGPNATLIFKIHLISIASKTAGK